MTSKILYWCCALELILFPIIVTVAKSSSWADFCRRLTEPVW